MKQQILYNRQTRSKTLKKPESWTDWQKISHRLQIPPLSRQETEQLTTFAKIIGFSDSCAKPIEVCVRLSQHYDRYRNSLTFNHKLKLFNEYDLLGNILSDLPAEYIIVDDDNFGFNISEINDILELNRHPYTGKDWEQVTIKSVPFMTYMEKNQVNPVHLIHQMKSVIEEDTRISDDPAIERLMLYYSYLTYPMCQVYADNPHLRTELLHRIDFPSSENATFSDFVEDLIAHLISFPEEYHVDIRRYVYRYWMTSP